MRVDIPLQRYTDKRDIGTLTLIRNEAWILYDDNGRRLPVPRKEDRLIVTLTRATGEQVVWTSVPFVDLLEDASLP